MEGLEMPRDTHQEGRGRKRKERLVEQTRLERRVPGTSGHIDSSDDSNVAGAKERS